MKYYKYIDISNFEVIQAKTISFIEMRGEPSIGFSRLPIKEYAEHCPEIMTAFDSYKIKPLMVALYTTARQDQSRVHIDYNSKYMPQCRINIPILNCEGSRTEFYTGGEYDTVVQPNGLPFLSIKEGSVPIKVDEVEIIKPTVIRVKEPHRVQTNVERIPRICMTVQFNIDPVFLLE